MALDILIVDDEQDIRDLVSGVLDDEDAPAGEAEGGRGGHRKSPMATGSTSV